MTNAVEIPPPPEGTVAWRRWYDEHIRCVTPNHTYRERANGTKYCAACLAEQSKPKAAPPPVKPAPVKPAPAPAKPVAKPTKPTPKPVAKSAPAKSAPAKVAKKA